MVGKKIPFYFVILSALVGAAVSYLILQFLPQQSSNTSLANSAVPCNYELSRLSGYRFVKPLLFAEQECESKMLAGLKQDVANLIEKDKKAGKMTSASFYIKAVGQGWTAVNADDTFHIAGLINVPLLMGYMRMAETDANLLSKELLCENNSTPTNGTALQAGKKYPINTLLRSMIINEDLVAMQILYKNIDREIFKKLFTDFGMPNPPENINDITMTARNFTLFTKALYNATYLTNNASEFAIALMDEVTLKEGIIKGLSSSCKLASTFGKWGSGNNQEVTEAGIVYYNNKAYIITVSTKGNDAKKLTEEITNLSKLVYDKLSGTAPNS
jgi:beta-lactamase class A